MKNSLKITTVIEHPELLEDRVEELAYSRHHPAYGRQKMPGTSSAETYVSGMVAMKNSGIEIITPFITCFVFTCIKRTDNVYKLEWSSSLS